MDANVCAIEVVAHKEKPQVVRTFFGCIDVLWRLKVLWEFEPRITIPHWRETLQKQKTNAANKKNGVVVFAIEVCFSFVQQLPG